MPLAHAVLVMSAAEVIPPMPVAPDADTRTQLLNLERYDFIIYISANAARTGLAGHTGNSITELGRLERELALVRARGYARDNEELELGVRCIAAGIRDDAGKLVAGLSISAPADFVQDDWIDLLCRTATQISEALGYEPSSA